jgi:tetratricopeptide (TPR) repeat protein
LPILETITKALDEARKSVGSRSGVERAPATEFPRQFASIDDHPLWLPARFRVREKLGEGGMGAVYRAYDAELGEEVAVKVLLRAAPEDVFSLKSEFRALAELRHPNLVDLYELIAEDSGCCFSMEVVPGSDLLTHLRGSLPVGSCPSLPTVRDAAAQLARALCAVHDAEKLHRDVKPHNVRVTPSGRVVLLDFGLVEPLGARSAHTRGSGGPLGTFGYMAPEQARGEALGPAADWFSYGATLYEVLTGRLPSDKPAAWLFGRSASFGVPRASTLSPDIPPDLDQLLVELLDPVPAQRPSGRNVLQRLAGTTVEAAGSPGPLSVLPARLPFENRVEELATLAEAFERSQRRTGVVVHVHGPSGIGKTELVRRFTEEQGAGATVLCGRCHPQEAVVFNALDGIVDELSRWLDGLPRGEVSAILPKEAGALPTLFPVLGRVHEIAEARRLVQEVQTQEARRLSIVALRELLASIADRQPLILWLDDVQWGDEDSGRILRQLLEGPDSPAALVILSYRTEDREQSPTLRALDSRSDVGGPEAVDLPLEPLTPAATERLFDKLLGSSFTGRRADFSRLAAESDGLPFFALELARSASVDRTLAPAGRQLRLSDLLLRRVQQLPQESRNLLEVVAVAGGPLERALLLRAAGVTGSGRRLLPELERGSFVRTRTIDANRETEIYHHKLRDAVLGALDEQTRRRHHRAIADAVLTSPNPTLATVVDHYEAAGDADAVRRYVVPAAKQAAQVLASDRAAKLYERAIDIGARDLSLSDLHARLAAALVEAGRGHAAARAFERAADLAEASSDELDRVVFLRRRSAEQFLQSGKWNEAPRALDMVLPRLGIRLPKSRAEAILRILTCRARTATKSIVLPPGAPLASPEAIDRATLLFTLNNVYSFTDFVTGMVFSSELLVDALRSGSAELLSMGLALETSAWAPVPGAFGRRQCDRLLSAYEEVAPRGTVFDIGGVHSTRAIVFWYRGRFTEALRSFEQAWDALSVARRDMSFLVAIQHCFRFPSLAHLGRLRQISTTLEPLLQDAEARGDDFLLSTVPLGHQCLAWLASGRIDLVTHWRKRVAELLPGGFSVSHQMCLLADVLSALYCGAPEEAREHLERAWPLLKGGFYLSMRYFREDLLQLRGRVALAEAAKSPARRPRLLREVTRLARAIETDEAPYAEAHAQLLRAGVARLSGRRRDAVRALELALAGFERSGLSLYAEASRLALGQLEGDAGASRRASACAWMKAEGAVDPCRLAAVMASGCIEPVGSNE